MNYIEVKFTISPYDPWADLLSADLGELGFESFIENNGHLLAYIEKDQFNESAIAQTETYENDDVLISFEWKELEHENWNKQWESNFSPVFVDDEICVRATFHETQPSYKYEIIIDPKMSFGTGHHATTHLVLSSMCDIDFQGKSVLDMGSGTGVLAIFAAMKGAKPVAAIDIDEWCSVNAQENADRNGVPEIAIFQGGKEKIEGYHVDVILANINRNILLDQMEEYAKALNQGGELHISGFYSHDVGVLVEEAKKHQLNFESQKSLNDWTTVKFRKL